MTYLLHRLGFVYKKTKIIPGKLDPQKQEAFKKEYEKLKQTKKPEDKIYFMDASHPRHNNESSYGYTKEKKDGLEPIQAGKGLILMEP